MKRVRFTLYFSLLSVQQHCIQKDNVNASIKNTLLLKNANHHLSLQRVIVVTSKITDHRLL